MLTLALVMMLGGFYLAYAGLKGRHILDDTRGFFA